MGFFSGFKMNVESPENTALRAFRMRCGKDIFKET